MKAKRRPASAGGPDWSSVLVDGRLVTGAGVAVGLAVGAETGVDVGPGTGVMIGPTIGLGVGVGAGVAIGGGAGAAHVALVIVFVSKVTAPFRDSARPSIVAPVVTVID